MFIDQEEKVGPVRKWIFRLLKLSFVLLALLAIFITILANMGGSSDSLKSSAEKIIGETFGGRPTVIQTLVRLSFFPLVGMDIEKVQATNKRPEGSVQDSEAVAVISKFKFFMDFWDVVFSNPRFRSLLIEGGYFGKGIISDKSISIERVYVDHDRENNKAQIVANGLYDKDEWKLNFGLDVIGSLGQYEYEIAETSPFSLAIADVKISGRFVKGDNNFMTIKDLKFIRDKQEIEGNLYASMISPRVVKLKSDFFVGADEKKKILIDVILDFKEPVLRISGDVIAENLSLDSIFGDESVRSLFNRVYEIIRDIKPAENNRQALLWLVSAADADINFDVKNMILHDGHNADFKMRAIQKNHNLSFQNINGQVDSMNFDIPALAVLPLENDKMISILSANILTRPVFNILGVDTQKIKGLEKDDTKNIFCAMAAIFEDGSSLLQNVYSNPEAKTIPLSVPAYTFLGSVFESPQEKNCLSFFRQE